MRMFLMCLTNFKEAAVTGVVWFGKNHKKHLRGMTGGQEEDLIHH